jgi:digeranylgeranylglycerophospholipid reductase
MRNYHRGWMKRIGKELRRDLAIHESFARLTDRQLEDLIRLLDKPHIIEMVQQFGDIDFPSKVGWRLVREEPRLLKYAGNALRILLRRGG